MLGAYLSSVIIWTAILYATVKLLLDELVDKGWTEEKRAPKIRNFILLCAVPMVRLFAWVMILYMAIVPKKK